MGLVRRDVSWLDEADLGVALLLAVVGLLGERVIGLKADREPVGSFPGLERGGQVEGREREKLVRCFVPGAVLIDLGCFRVVPVSPTAKTDNSCTPNSDPNSSSEVMESKLLDWLARSSFWLDTSSTSFGLEGLEGFLATLVSELSSLPSGGNGASVKVWGSTVESFAAD